MPFRYSLRFRLETLGSGADKRRSWCPSAACFLAARRLVGQNDDAVRADRFRVHEPQGFHLFRVPEETLPTPHNDGKDHQAVLVYEVVLHQRAHEVGAAEDEDVLAVSLLEP